MSIVIVIPCSARKVDTTRPVPAGRLYQGPIYQSALAASEALAHRIEAGGQLAQRVILSAKHGLLDFGTRVLPYDVTFGDAGAVGPDVVAVQLVEHLAEDVVSLCPSRYTAVLQAAVQLAAGDLIRVHTPLAGVAGIGDIRGRLARIRRGELDALPAPATAR